MMGERREFEMTQAQLDALLEACRPVPYILGTGGVPPRSPQENANDAWRALGEELGFDYKTVSPAPGKGDRFFTAASAPVLTNPDEPAARTERAASEPVTENDVRGGTEHG